jgi:hypothetical protein
MNLESTKLLLQNQHKNYLICWQMLKFWKTENIAKFEVIGDDAFIFGLRGMPEINSKWKKKVAPSKVVLGAASEKLSFHTLIAKLMQYQIMWC